MLDAALLFFQQELSHYIKIQTGGQKEEAVQFPDMTVDASGALKSNAIALLLLNMEEERIFRAGATRVDRIDRKATVANIPTLSLYLHLLFVANFKDYIEGARILSFVIRFFRSYRAFVRQEFPALSPEIHQLTTELVNLTFQEQSELARSLELDRRPSVLYKVRMLIYQDAVDALDLDPPITVLQANIKGI